MNDFYGVLAAYPVAILIGLPGGWIITRLTRRPSQPFAELWFLWFVVIVTLVCVGWWVGNILQAKEVLYP